MEINNLLYNQAMGLILMSKAIYIIFSYCEMENQQLLYQSYRILEHLLHPYYDPTNILYNFRFVNNLLQFVLVMIKNNLMLCNLIPCYYRILKNQKMLMKILQEDTIAMIYIITYMKNFHANIRLAYNFLYLVQMLKDIVFCHYIKQFSRFL